ncbi:unnamed protein product [Arctia plantaginis]|uniref:Uncharacterized protein n=1 Tax=Arctia plantaginis TaxID=874455 RepID=A0A8S1ASK4_ARCPL|nr:unnamed protein product [Arctia plantaginis]
MKAFVNKMPLLRNWINYGISKVSRDTSNNCIDECKNNIEENCGDCTLTELKVMTALCIEEAKCNHR